MTATPKLLAAALLMAGSAVAQTTTTSSTTTTTTNTATSSYSTLTTTVTATSCTGRFDGYFCSRTSPSQLIQCKSGQVVSKQICYDGCNSTTKTCVTNSTTTSGGGLSGN